MSLIFVFVLVVAACVLLKPVGIYESNLASDFATWNRAVPAVNRGSSAISNGCAVAVYSGASDSSTMVKAINNSLGAVLPNYSNYRVLGIAKAKNGRSIAAASEFPLVTEGYTIAKVYVPASTALPINTELTLASTWDATNNQLIFGTGGTGSAPTNQGVLAAAYAAAGGAVGAGVIPIRPWNPLARLVTPIASGSARVEECLVYVYPNHQPRALPLQYTFAGGNTTTKTGMLLLPAQGPGIFDYLYAQLLNCGSAGSVAINAFARRASTPDTDQALFSTAINIVNDGTDGAVAGLEAAGTGDTDDGGLGTAGVMGTLASEALRMFADRSAISATATYTGGTAQADLRLVGVATFF